MEQATEQAIAQFAFALRAYGELERQRQRLAQLVRSIPPKDYDSYLRTTNVLLQSSGLGHLPALRFLPDTPADAPTRMRVSI